MIMKRLLTAGALAIALVLMSLPANTSARPANDTVTIRLSTWDSGTGGLAPYEKGIAAFEQSHPGIKVDLESIAPPVGQALSWYIARVLTEIAAGNGPDVMLVPDDQARYFAHSGQLIDLAPALKKYNVQISQFYPNVWNLGNLNGTTYYVPKDWADLSVQYNKTMFQKAGLPFPKAGWTWDDLLKDAQKLTIMNGGHPVQWGVQLQGDWLRASFSYFVHSAGGHVLSPDGTTTTGYLTSKTTRSALQYFLSLYYKYHISPTPADLSTFGSLNLFNAQKVAMVFDGPWRMADPYEKNPNLKFGVAPVPVGPLGKPITEPFWAGYGVSKSSKHLDAAEQFVAWSASEAWARIDAVFSMPANKSVAVAVSMKRDPNLKVFFDQANNVVPEEEMLTLNWDGDVVPPLQHMIEQASISGSDANVQALITTASQAINGNLAKTYKK
jgi:multiple sugar transport system substrate-binding protein